MIIFLMSVLCKGMAPIIIIFLLLLLILIYISIFLDQYCWQSIQFVFCFNAPFTMLKLSVLPLYCIRLAIIWSWPNVHGDIWSTWKVPECEKRNRNSRAMKKLSPSSWWSHSNTAANLMMVMTNKTCITKTFHRQNNIKPIIRSIYT